VAQVVDTLVLAAVYGLMAIGISLTWAGLGLLNLAQGVTFAVSAYGAWLAASHISSNGAVVILAGILTGALAGAATWLLVFVPLDGKPNWDNRTIIATLALGFIGANGLQVIFGTTYHSLPAIFGSGKFSLGGTVVTSDRAGTIVSGVVLLGVVLLALMRTRIGLGVRALTQNTEGAALVGINRTTAALAILAVSGALAGLASVLLAQILFVYPDMGSTPLVKGLIVALLGGLGSMWGTIIAAVLVGLVEVLTGTYLNTQYVLITLFGLMAVVLIVRPRGIAGILESTRA
jgi:branched-chain amino acid transport system permease protein